LLTAIALGAPLISKAVAANTPQTITCISEACGGPQYIYNEYPSGTVTYNEPFNDAIVEPNGDTISYSFNFGQKVDAPNGSSLVFQNVNLTNGTSSTAVWGYYWATSYNGSQYYVRRDYACSPISSNESFDPNFSLTGITPSTAPNADQVVIANGSVCFEDTNNAWSGYATNNMYYFYPQ
jgi:hypothetical protein